MAEARTAQGGGDRRGEPIVALLLTWFLPGAGHAYIGRGAQAALCFFLVQGLYALGWMLSDGRVFEFLDPELRGPFATLLAPEVGNLGAMIAQLRVVGFGPDEPSPFPTYIALGGTLTALSGLANIFCMVHVHLEARAPRTAPRQPPNPALVAALAWAVPGLGHLVQGRRARGLVVFALLMGFFLWGTWLCEGANLSRQRHFYYWSGQFLVGLPALLAELVSGRPPVSGPLAHGDAGLLFACMPGLLNVLAMLDVYGVAEARWLGRASSDGRGDVAGDSDGEQAEAAA